MLENLRNEIYLPGALIIAGFFLLSGVVGLWYIRKTTGRPLRDMLAELAGAVVLIGVLVTGFVLFNSSLHSPDRHVRRMAERLLFIAFMGVALLVYWLSNRVAKPKRLEAQSDGDHRD